MNTVITIGREFGSGGREFGYKLAKELEVAYYDKQILSEIVDKTEYSREYVQDIIESRPSYIMPSTVSVGTSIGCEYQLIQMKEIVQAQTEVILEMASRSSCVIVGRCADYILRDVENVRLFRIFIYADLQSRIKRCIDRAPEGENYTAKELEKHIKRVDKNRAGYYSDFTLQKWGDKNNYDLCINTSKIRIDDAVTNVAKLL
ncbi:MAG: cytidylate kinase-like family protein [Parasporobacterium sp.]|nr:cytidylate kinase-like family protein [Parasporobacterium sp.]